MEIVSALLEFTVSNPTSQYLECQIGAEEKNRTQRSPENVRVGGGGRIEEGSAIWNDKVKSRW